MMRHHELAAPEGMAYIRIIVSLLRARL